MSDDVYDCSGARAYTLMLSNVVVQIVFVECGVDGTERRERKEN